VHPIFPGKGLDEIFQTDITADIIACSNGLLDCKEAGSEGRVERLQVESEFVHDRLELGVPLVSGEGGEEGIETTEGGDGGAVVKFGFQRTDGIMGDETGEEVGGLRGGGYGDGCCRRRVGKYGRGGGRRMSDGGIM
jgi:hypothetical protein